jgi:iron-sulfur cluster assembly protein
MTEKVIELTSQAAEQVRKAATEGGSEGLALRFAGTRKPDGSIDYRMGFDAPKEGDVRITSNNVELVLASDYEDVLRGTLVDFVELEPGQFHFVFLNPNDANYTPPTEE